MSIMMQRLNGLKGTVGSLARISRSEVLLRFPGPIWYPVLVTQQNVSTFGQPFSRSNIGKSAVPAMTVLCEESLCMKETGQNWSLIQKRYRWRQKLVRAPPTKPLSFDYSGDQTLSVGTVDLSDPKLGFEHVEELQHADENVKKIFSLEFGTNSAVMSKLIHDLLEKVKDHPLDLQSLEVIIAKDTIMIRNEIKHCLQFRNDKINKARLIKRIFRRKRMLKDLKSKDIEKFNWLVGELKIHYVEETKFDHWKLSKKGLRKKVARDAALALKKQKMEEFRKKLQQEWVIFEKYRDAEMETIEAELQKLGINEMTTLKDALEAMNMGDLLPKPEPKLSRRRLLLHKKFELYGERKKVLDEQILKNHGFLTEKEMPFLP